MRTFYDADDDILTLHISDAAVAREVSPDWNTCISYAADGSVVEVVVLEASQQGRWPLPGSAKGSQAARDATSLQAQRSFSSRFAPAASGAGN